jgi:hypothetical protein
MIFRYSALDTAYQCLKKYENIYILGLKQEGHSRDIEFGTALHLGLKDIMEGGEGSLSFSMYWDSVADKQFSKSRFDHAELRKLGLTFLERFNKLHAKKFKVFKLEEAMETTLEGFTLQGTADVIGDYEGIPSIIDFKTSAKEYPKEKIIKNPQMYIYAYMAKKLWKYEAKQLVYTVFIKTEGRIQTVKTELTKDKLDDMINNELIMIRDLASRKEFPRNPNCFCNFPGICYPKGGIK